MKEVLNLNLNDLLKEKRKEKNFTMKELANKSGISESYISKIENDAVNFPKRERLLSLAYALDPENIDNLYTRFLKITNQSTEDSEKEFNQFSNRKNVGIDSGYLNKSFIDSNVRIDKKNAKVIATDYPYFDIEWLVNQRNFQLFLGKSNQNVIVEGKDEKELLSLDENEQERLIKIINVFKEGLLKERTTHARKYNEEQILSKNNKYELIFDLLNNEINDEEQLVRKLKSIDEDRELFTAHEYHEELQKAASNNDAIALQKLIKMKTLNDLGYYKDSLYNKEE